MGVVSFATGLMMMLTLQTPVATQHFEIEGKLGGETSSVLTIETLGRELELARSNVFSLVPPVLRARISHLRYRVFVASTTQEFVRRSGVGPYHAAGSRGREIYLQPLALLSEYDDLPAVLRHEIAHTVLETLYGHRLERWLFEGLAMHLSGERPPPPVNLKPSRKRLVEAEVSLINGKDQAALREAYRLAFDAVSERLGAKSMGTLLLDLAAAEQVNE